MCEQLIDTIYSVVAPLHNLSQVLNSYKT